MRFLKENKFNKIKTRQKFFRKIIEILEDFSSTLKNFLESFEKKQRNTKQAKKMLIEEHIPLWSFHQRSNELPGNRSGRPTIEEIEHKLDPK